MIKHATAGIFVFSCVGQQWELGLIEHPRLGRWMIPGGHVEAYETQAEAALREVAEETGLDSVRLLDGVSLPLPAGVPDSYVRVPLPWWITELKVAPDNHLAEPHVHVDHQFVAITEERTPVGPAEHPFAWYSADRLAGLSLFEDTRSIAKALFGCIGDLADGRPMSAKPLGQE